MIQTELAELILKKARDPRLGEVSLTEVDVSPDLSQARVYFSLLEPERKDQVLAAFESAAPFLRHELATRLHLKTMPRLVPTYDGSLARGAAMDKLLRELNPGPADSDSEGEKP